MEVIIDEKTTELEEACQSIPIQEKRVIEFKIFERADSSIKTAYQFTPLQQSVEVSSTLTEWTEEEIVDFLEDCTDNQLLFLNLLAREKSVQYDDIIQQMANEIDDPSFTGSNLSGSLSGITRRTNKLEKEELYTGDYFDFKGEQHWHYFIPEKHRSIVLAYFYK